MLPAFPLSNCLETRKYCRLDGTGTISVWNPHGEWDGSPGGVRYSLYYRAPNTVLKPNKIL